MPEDRSHVLAFLYKIIDDSQATIRFLDTKAGFGIAVLGTKVGKALLDHDELAGFGSRGLLVLSLAVVFGLIVIVAAVLGFKTVFPTVNPARNVSFPDDLEPKFFISKMSCCRFLRLFSGDKKFAMLEETHARYCGALRDATAEKLESILAAEVLKLSFIRQMKTDRLAWFAKALTAAVVLFTALMLSPRKQAAPLPPIRHESTPVSADQGPRDIYNYSAARPRR